MKKIQLILIENSEKEKHLFAYFYLLVVLYTKHFKILYYIVHYDHVFICRLLPKIVQINQKWKYLE